MMNNKQNRLYLFENEKISIALLKLGIPMMIGMMTSALYNLVDSYFVGKLGTAQIGAVSIVYPISILMLGVGLLFGSGASSYISRLLGSKDYDKASYCASTAIFTSMITSVFLIIIMLIFLNPMLKMLGSTDSIFPYAREYGIIFIIGLIFNVFNITANNIIASEGASFYSMIAMLIGGIINVFLDPIFIFTLGMGVKGAAVATLISRCISTGVYLYYINSGKSNIKISIYNFKPKKEIFLEIFKIGIPMLIYQILCSSAISITNIQASIYGDSVVASFGIVNRIISLGNMILSGFLKGYQPFVGYNNSAMNFKRENEATNIALIWSSLFCFIMAIYMITERKSLIQVFSKNDMDVINIGVKILVLNAVTFITMGYQSVHSFRFMGIGMAKEGGMISIGRQGVFFIPAIIILSKLFGINGLLIAQPLADILSLILVYILVKNSKKLKNTNEYESLIV